MMDGDDGNSKGQGDMKGGHNFDRITARERKETRQVKMNEMKRGGRIRGNQGKKGGGREGVGIMKIGKRKKKNEKRGAMKQRGAGAEKGKESLLL